MKLDYHKVWKTMNSLESVTSKICSAREILDSAIDALENHKLEKTETLLYAVDEYLQYYLEEFDRKFKDAWQETVVEFKQKDTIQFNIDPTGNEIDFLSVGAGNTAYDYLANSLLTEDRISNFPEEQDPCMPPWGHSDMEALRYTDEEMDAMCDNAAKQDKVIRWQLPVEEVEDGDTGEQEYFITFPDDLLEAAGLNINDELECVDQGDGSFLLRKITKPLETDEC